jgi:hypothetical protein
MHPTNVKKPIRRITLQGTDLDTAPKRGSTNTASNDEKHILFWQWNTSGGNILTKPLLTTTAKKEGTNHAIHHSIFSEYIFLDDRICCPLLHDFPLFTPPVPTCMILPTTQSLGYSYYFGLWTGYAI